MQNKKWALMPQKEKPVVSLQDQVLGKLKKFYKTSATIRNQDKTIKINSLILVDRDLEFYKEIEGMYKDITVKRSGVGVVVILKF